MKSSIASRIRVTNTGKFIRRKMGLDHFRAKKNSTRLRRKNETAFLAWPDRRVFAKKYGLKP